MSVSNLYDCLDRMGMSSASEMSDLESDTETRMEAPSSRGRTILPSSGGPSHSDPTSLRPPPFHVPSLSLDQVGAALSYGVLNPEAEKNGENVYWHFNPGPKIYSRKVFIGGLPIDIGEEELRARFGKFGNVFIDWPYKSSITRPSCPPKGLSGYVFLIFADESSVHALVDYSHKEEHDRYFIRLSSPTMKDKPVQVRPWRVADSDFLVNQPLSLDARKSVFVGAVPRPMKAVELAQVMEQLYGKVAYAGIDTDQEYRYPKGSGRVIFSSEESYIAAISTPFLQIHLGDMEKRVQVKPYVLDGQCCEECGVGKAPFFCPSTNCLRYFCEPCWTHLHGPNGGRDGHRALVKDANDRARTRPHSFFPQS